MSESILAFQSQLSGVMETVFKAAMYEIVRLVEESFVEEVSRSREQVESLKKRLQWSESRRREREADGRSRCAECGRSGAERERAEDRLPGAEGDSFPGAMEGHGLKQEGPQEGKWNSCPRESADLPSVQITEEEAMPSTIKDPQEKIDSVKKEADLLMSGSSKDRNTWNVSMEGESSVGHLDGPINEHQAQCYGQEWASGLRQTSQSPAEREQRYSAGFSVEELSGLEDVLRTEPKGPYMAHMFDTAALGSQGFEDPLGPRLGFGAGGHVQAELEAADGSEQATVLPIPSRSRRAVFTDQHGPVSGSTQGEVDIGELNYLLINEEGYLQDTGERYWEQRAGSMGTGVGALGKRLHTQELTPVPKNTESVLNVRPPSQCRERARSCSQCHLTFPDLGALKTHLSTHKAGSAYTCTQCGKCFTQACNLKVHQRIHSRDGLHLCSHCGKGFVSFADLKKHKCSHAGDKPYCCMLCGNKFSRLWNLKLHRRIHTQEKPHQCSQCEKSFTRADILKVHQRTHTGERPYCCSLCGLSFKRLDHLKSHQRKHRPQDP